MRVEQVGPVRRQVAATVGELTNHVVEYGDPVFILRENLEVRPDSDVTSMLPKDVGRELVNGAELGTVGVFAEDVVHPLPHLRGSLVGEGKSEGSRVVVLFQQPGEPQGQDGGLTGTWAGEDQKRTLFPLHGAALVLVEILESDHCQPPLASERAFSSTSRISGVTPACSRPSISMATSAAALVFCPFR